ncbi:hypothetical protein F4810DRAFT_707973 [Camillea tinctor]|nr:hypothetical protein F4810DRAFT_707973 [Camillea tinctor]
MVALPQEIIDHIVSFLPRNYPSFNEEARNYFPRCASVSRQFQLAIEWHTFDRLTASSDNTQLRNLRHVLDPRRRSYLREIRYQIILPRAKQVLFSAFEQPEERHVNDEAFTLAIKQLFRVLQPQEQLPRGIHLCIQNIVSPSDAFIGKQFVWRRFQRSRIKLLVKPEQLPLLPNVSVLTLFRTAHFLDPRTIIDIATRLPHLKAMNLVFNAREFVYSELAERDRRSLADAINEHTEALKRVTKVRLFLVSDGGPINQLMPMPRFVWDGTYDYLGSTLRRWSRGLESLELQGNFDGTLFWPHRSEPEFKGYRSTLKHSKLKRLNVSLERYTPSSVSNFVTYAPALVCTKESYLPVMTVTFDSLNSWWYFMPFFETEYGVQLQESVDMKFPLLSSKEECKRLMETEKAWGIKTQSIPRLDRLPRTEPVSETINPLIESWARALMWMPELEESSLTFMPQRDLTDRDDTASDDVHYNWTWEWKIIYLAPNTTNSQWGWIGDDEDKKCRRLIFCGVREWQPYDAIMRLLYQAGKRAHPHTDMVIIELG